MYEEFLKQPSNGGLPFNQKSVNMHEELFTQADANGELLVSKKTQLEELQQETEKSLTSILAAENAAKKVKIILLRLQVQLAEKIHQIAERTDVVEGDLSAASLACQRARTAVKGIKTEQLEEIRRFANPPIAVRLTLQAVCILLGHNEKKAKNWRDVRGIISNKDFIKSILEFDIEMITEKMRKIFERDYLNHEKFNYETVNRSSVACGPLVVWARVQMKYSGLLEKVGLFRQEIKDLEVSANEQKEQAAVLAEKVAELEDQIGEDKREHSQLMQKQTELQNEMLGVPNQTDLAMIDFIADELIPSMEVEDLSEECFNLMLTSFCSSNLNRGVFVKKEFYRSQGLVSDLISRRSSNSNRGRRGVIVQTENSRSPGLPFDVHVVSLDIRGFENLWKVIFECRDPNVSKQAIGVLRSLFESCIWSLKQAMFEKAINIVMTKLRQPDLSQLAINRSFSVLHMIKKDFIITESLCTSSASYPMSILQLCVRDDRDSDQEIKYVSFKTLPETTVGDLKRKISKTLDCRFDQVELFAIGKKQTNNDAKVQVHSVLENGFFRIISRAEEQEEDDEMEEKYDVSMAMERFTPDPTAMLLDPGIFETLFQYLSSEYPDCAESCWKLLMKLPKQKMFMEDFEDFEGMRWKKHLKYSKKSYLALLYILDIIAELADACAKAKKDNLNEIDVLEDSWSDKFFLRAGGLVMLVDLLKNFQFNAMGKTGERFFHRIWCVKSLVVIITMYLNDTDNRMRVVQIPTCRKAFNDLAIIKRVMLFLQIIAKQYELNEQKLNSRPLPTPLKDIENPCFVLYEHTILCKKMSDELTGAFQEIIKLFSLLYEGFSKKVLVQ